MQSTKAIGDAGEDLAAQYLENHGYKIIDRNFRTRFGEIDIIAKKDGVLIFVEVKKKNSLLFGHPAEMVSAVKIKKIINTAEFYMSEINYNKDWRIDVVCILGKDVEILESVTI